MNDSEQILKAKSVINTFNILKIAFEDPANMPGPILEACKSQGALAALDFPESEICSMSLNTMKTHADNNGAILWKNLNDLRNMVLKKHAEFVQSQYTPSRGSKAHLKDQLVLAKKKLQNENNNTISYVDRYDHLLTLCRDHSQSSTRFRAKFNLHLVRYAFMDDTADIRSKLRIIDGGRNG